MCEPLIIETGCRQATITILDDQTVVTIDHAKKPVMLPLLLWVFGPIQEQNLGPVPGVHMTTMTDSQQVTGKITPVDKKGNPAPVEAGSSVFKSTDVNILTVTQDAADQLSVTVKAVAAGAAQVMWSADADLGDGVVTITAAEDFVITGGQAVGAGFSFGTPVEQA